MHGAILAVDALIAASSLGVGFLAGFRAAGHRIPQLLARCTPEQIRYLASRTSELRRQAR
jgi:hypothetical protein